MYGKEVILDIHNCDVSKFNRTSIRQYFKQLCKDIKMKRDKLIWWDDKGVPKKYCQTQPHTKGISAVQFILTSSIVIHTLPDLKCVYINIFSCKDFNEEVVKELSEYWFDGSIVQYVVLDRM